MADQTIGDLRLNAFHLDAFVSALLTALASGKYNDEVVLTENLLNEMGLVLPPFAMLEKGLEFALWVNKVTAPRAAVIPDGRGGWVPEDNSRYDPKTGDFL